MNKDNEKHDVSTLELDHVGSKVRKGSTLEPNYLGKRLREIREHRKLGTLKVACKVLGVSNASLALYEIGTSLPGVEFLAKFAEVTGADFKELMQLRLQSSKEPASAAALISMSETRGPVAQTNTEPASALDYRLGAVDPKIMGEIAYQMSRSLFFSPQATRLILRFYRANCDVLNELQALRKPPSKITATDVRPLLLALSNEWLVFAASETWLTTGIYNRVAHITDPAALQAAIEREVADFNRARGYFLPLEPETQEPPSEDPSMPAAATG